MREFGRPYLPDGKVYEAEIGQARELTTAGYDSYWSQHKMQPQEANRILTPRYQPHHPAADEPKAHGPFVRLIITGYVNRIGPRLQQGDTVTVPSRDGVTNYLFQYNKPVNVRIEDIDSIRSKYRVEGVTYDEFIQLS